MNIVFMSMDTLPSTLWARDLYDQMHIRSDFRKWFPRMCQYGFIEGRDYEYMPRVRLQDEGGRTVQRYVKDYRITQDMAKKLCKLHHTAVGAAYRPQPFDWDTLLGLLHKKPPRRSSYEAQLSDSDSLVTTTQIAKEYGCGAKVFNRLLHLHGIQYRVNGQWVLYSEHHGKGYTSSLTFRLQRSDGSEVEKLHTAWTQKGGFVVGVNKNGVLEELLCVHRIRVLANLDVVNKYVCVIWASARLEMPPAALIFTWGATWAANSSTSWKVAPALEKPVEVLM